MEFWGFEVKAGAPVKVDVNSLHHLSLASLGEVKKDKGSDSVSLFLNIDGKKLVIGTLSAGKISQITFDMVLNKTFELSHNWKNGSVYFVGYKHNAKDDDSTDSDSDIGEDLPVIKDNGEPEPKDENVNVNAKKSNAAKSKVKTVDANKDDDSEDDSDEDESEEEPMNVSGEDSSDEEEDAPKKGKKRPANSSSKAAVSEKKAKLITPQKTTNKKGEVVHVATPYPSKKAGKTPANNEKPKQQTQKSSGQAACKSCSKTFNSDTALESHTKAKHTGSK